MKLSDLILNNYDSLDDLKRGVETLEFCEKLDTKLYSNYYNNFVYFKHILKTILEDLEKHKQDLSEKDLIQIFNNICIRLEQVEIQLMSTTLTEVAVSENGNEKKSQIKNLDTLEALLSSYTDRLCLKYKSLDNRTKNEVKLIYELKCDIIDFFDSTLSGKV